MAAVSPVAHDAVRYELRFHSVVDGRAAHAFPCDARGHVDMDLLSEAAVRTYLYARTVIGREFRIPAVFSVHAPGDPCSAPARVLQVP